MTDLQRLYDAIDGRTKGNWSWEFTHPGYLLFSERHLGGTWILDASGDANDQSVECRPSDRDFIALTGSCADEIKAVLQAAQDHSSCGSDRTDSLRESLTALAAKVKECGK